MIISEREKAFLNKINSPFPENKLFLLIFFIFLINLPPLYFGRSIYFFSKLILLIIFLLIVLEKVTSHKKEKKNKRSTNKLIGAFFLLFIPATISILNADNIWAFLSVYQNIIFTTIFLYITNNILIKNNEIKKIIFIFIITGFINAITEFFIYYNPTIYPGLFKDILTPGTFNAINYYLNKGKGTYETFLQIQIPLILYLLINNKNNLTQKIFYMIYLLLIIITSILSNLRTFFIMAVFGSIGSIIIYSQTNTKKNFFKITTALIFFLIIIIRLISLTNVKTPIFIIDRLMLTEIEDVKTINFRYGQWQKTIEIGRAYPFVGVGLGNFPEYAPSSDIRNSWMDKIDRKGNPPSYFFPHNLLFTALAETGITGLICLLILFSYFIKTDIQAFFSNNLLKKSLIVSFWTIVLFSMFNPAQTFQFFIYFWFIRSSIIKL